MCLLEHMGTLLELSRNENIASLVHAPVTYFSPLASLRFLILKLWRPFDRHRDLKLGSKRLRVKTRIGYTCVLSCVVFSKQPHHKNNNPKVSTTNYNYYSIHHHLLLLLLLLP